MGDFDKNIFYCDFIFIAEYKSKETVMSFRAPDKRGKFFEQKTMIKRNKLSSFGIGRMAELFVNSTKSIVISLKEMQKSRVM